MFKFLFSFKGRIRRLEYGLGLLISMCLVILLIYIVTNRDSLFLIYIILISFYWFNLAQGFKRCHDLDKSGFYQFIPLYGFWLLFEEGTIGENKYGENPKNKANVKVENDLSSLKNDILKNKTRFEFYNELICFVLINTFIIVICFKYLDYQFELINIWSVLSIIIGYFLILLIIRNKDKLINSKKYLLKYRIIYALLLFLSLRLYSILFLNYHIQYTGILYEIFIIVVIFWLTYLPYILYLNIFEKEIKYV